MVFAWMFGFLLYLCTNIQTKVKQKLKNYNIMTREEITKKLDDLSQEVYALGRECTKHIEQPMLVLLGELLKNTSFTMDSFREQIETVEE